MNVKIVLLCLAVIFLVVGCTSVDVSDSSAEKPAPAVPQPEEVLNSNSNSNSNAAKAGDISIIISNGRVIPEEIILEYDTKATLVIDNQDDSTKRIDIPLYGSEVSVDVAPGTYEVVSVNPKVKGLVLIELNGASAGTIVVE